MRVLLVFLLLVPLAVAGSQEDPEIKDNAGDVRWSYIPVSPEPVPFPTEHADSFDILASWFHNETPSSISVSMQVADLSVVDDFDSTPDSFARWGTRFEMSNYVPDSRDNWWNYTWIATVSLGNGPAGWRAFIAQPDAGGERGDERAAEFNVDRQDSILTLTIDRADLGSPMAGDAMIKTLSLHDGQLGALDFSDQSPDGTYPSRDYVFRLDTGNATGTPTEPPAPGPGPAEPSGPGNGTNSDGSKSTPAPWIALPTLVALAWLRRR